MIDFNEVKFCLKYRSNKVCAVTGSGATWSFLHAPSLAAASFLLSPTGNIFCCVFVGQDFCYYAVTIRDMPKNWEMISSYFRVIVFPVVLFPFQWWVRTWGVFFGSEQKISEGYQMLAIFTYFWSFRVNETKGQKTLGGCLSAVRSQMVCRRCWSWFVCSTTGLEWRGADLLTLTSLNKEDYLNGKWYY